MQERPQGRARALKASSESEILCLVKQEFTPGVLIFKVFFSCTTGLFPRLDFICVWNRHYTCPRVVFGSKPRGTVVEHVCVCAWVAGMW